MERRPVPHLVAKVQDEESRQGDVRRKEVLVVPVDKHLKSVCERQDADHDQGKPSRIWLSWSLERKCHQESLDLERLTESQKSDEQNNPADVSRDGGKVGEPGKDLCAVVGYVQVRKQGERPGHQDGGIWDTALGGSGKNAGGLTVLS